jgi:phytoene synthase
MPEVGGLPAAGHPLAQGIPPGSLRHYAVLYSGLDDTAPLAAVYAFEQEIADTARGSGHEVAHARLQWWRAEVDRLLHDQPVHPVTRALTPLRATADLHLLHEALVAADIDLACMTFDNHDELEAYCFRASGSLQTLAAQACAGSRHMSEGERAFARALGAAVRQTEMLRDIRLDVGHGRLHVPLEQLERAGIDPLEVRADTASAAFLFELHRWRDELRNRLLALPGLLTRPERAAQRQGLVLAALYLKLLDNIRHEGELARTRAEVPDWTRLWTAWRTALRYR